MLELLDLNTTLRIGHLLALSLGLGGAVLLDLVTCRFFLTSRITPTNYALIAFASSIVGMALVALWISGLAFLAHYYFVAPEKLANPKIWVKLGVVLILTLNGAFIHRKVLPFLEAQVGLSLFHGTTASRRAMLLTTAAISGVSWFFPMVYGAIRQLHPAESLAQGALAFAVPYLLVLGVAVCGAQLVGRFVSKPFIRDASVQRDKRELDRRMRTDGGNRRERSRRDCTGDVVDDGQLQDEGALRKAA